MWWIVINPDGTQVFTHAAGHVIGESGRANFASHLLAGRPVLDPLGNENVLQDPIHSIVFLVLRRSG